MDLSSPLRSTSFERSVRVLGAVPVRRLSQSRRALPDLAATAVKRLRATKVAIQRGEPSRLAAFGLGNCLEMLLQAAMNGRRR
jgi:hypothetical protein